VAPELVNADRRNRSLENFPRITMGIETRSAVQDRILMQPQQRTDGVFSTEEFDKIFCL
jgi:hypothetical protein